MNKETFYTPSGEPIQITYEKITQPNGEKHLVETGKTNVFEKIQEYKDECDINQIIKRMTAGDIRAAELLNGAANKNYGDATNYNKSINQVNQVLKKADRSLNNLSEEEYEELKKFLSGKKEEEKATKEKATEEKANEIIEKKQGVTYE